MAESDPHQTPPPQPPPIPLNYPSPQPSTGPDFGCLWLILFFLGLLISGAAVIGSVLYCFSLAGNPGGLTSGQLSSILFFSAILAAAAFFLVIYFRPRRIMPLLLGFLAGSCVLLLLLGICAHG